MTRAFAALLLAPLLASCQPSEILVHAAFVGGELAFVAAGRGDADTKLCWREGAVVDDEGKAAWAFSGPGTGECGRLLPVFYGKPPAGAETTSPPRRIEAGRLYVFVGDALGQVSGAFSISRAGGSRLIHNVDPSSPAAAALRERWWARTRNPVAPPGPAEPAGNAGS